LWRVLGLRIYRCFKDEGDKRPILVRKLPSYRGKQIRIMGV
jgi:hypothetical protein